MSILDYNIEASLTEFEQCLIVTPSDEMTDDMISDLTEVIMKRVWKSELKGAIFNFARVKFMDPFIYSAFKRVSKALLFMGIPLVWAGMKPSAICALVDLGLDFDQEETPIVTAVDLESGLTKLHRQV